MKTLLCVRNLWVHMETRTGLFPVVRGVNLEIGPGEIVGLAGPSGSGKTMTASALLGLLPAPGTIRFEQYEAAGESIAPEEKSFRKTRGRGVAMIFQEPTSHLDPLGRVADQLAETLTARGVERSRIRDETERLLASVGLDPAKIFGRRYPHELSGGMNQRAMIALALACSPAVLIADEPTTALDDHNRRVTTELIQRHFRDRERGVLWISHDLSLLSGVADRLLIMENGRIVEEGGTRDLLASPQHPLTRALIDAMPQRLCLSKPEN